MKSRPLLRSLLLSLSLVLALAWPAQADEHDRHDHDRDHHEHRDFYGRDFHHFNEFELRLWTSGTWYNGWHDGRYGWWWIADGWWYWYPQPIYPYPTYVPQPVVVAPPPPPPPAPVVIQQPPPVPPPPQPAGQAPTQFWYYCDTSKAYYPYVQSCAGPWRSVPATPAGATPGQ